MANSQTIQITLKAVGDMSDVLSNVKQLQNVINQLKLPDNLKQNFTKLFNDVEKNGEKAANALASGFKTKSDVTNYAKNLDSVARALQLIQSNMSKIDDDILQDSFQVDTAQLERARQEVERLTKEVENISKGATGIDTLNSELAKMQGSYGKIRKSASDFIDAITKGDIKRATKDYNDFSAAADKVSDPQRAQDYKKFADLMDNSLNSIDTQKLQELTTELEKARDAQNSLKSEALQEFIDKYREITGVDLSQVVSGFNQMADSEKAAAEGTQEINSELENFKSKITYFFGAANAVNLFKRAVRSAFETVKDLDKVMTETAVVTSFDVGDMWEQLPEYTERANKLGVSIHDAYEAATLYYQQGLKTNEVMAVSNETLKMARIAGLDAADATDRMTNALRGFNMEITESNARNINDVYSNLAAKTASNVDEISTAMTKVASLANNANMSFENTAAFLSQIIETTRESAETAGTALKTVIARFSEVKNLYSEGQLLGDFEGEEIDVNKVSKALRTAGINLNEYLTGMKGLDDIFMELSAKWDSLDQVQQRYIATMAAGSRQQSRFIALMQDNARMTELVREANNAAGASQEQFDKTLESLQSKLERLHNAWNTFLMGLANNEAIKFLVDLLTDAISAINKLTAGLEGVPKSLASIAIAIGGFKLGKGIFNKLLGSIGKQLLPGLAKTGIKGGEELSEGIAKGFDIKGLGNSIKSGFSGFFKKISVNEVIPFDQLDFSKATDSFKENLIRQIDSIDINKLSISDAIRLKFNVDAGNIDEIKGELSDLGISMDQTARDAQKLGIQTKQTATTIGSVGAACATAGAGLMLITSLLEKAGVTSKPLLNTLKAISIALMAMPLIFKIIEAAGVKAGFNIQASFGWIGLAIAGLTGIIALLVTIGKQNSAEARLKRVQEAAKEAADAADEARQAYDNLLSSQSEYSELQDQLKNLTQGTKEWEEALYKANQQVLELLQTYTFLKDYIGRGEFGQLIIKDEGWTKLTDLLRNQATTTSAIAAYRQYKEDVETKTQERDKEIEEQEKYILDEYGNKFGALTIDEIRRFIAQYQSDPDNVTASYYKQLYGFDDSYVENVALLLDALNQLESTKVSDSLMDSLAPVLNANIASVPKEYTNYRQLVVDNLEVSEESIQREKSSLSTDKTQLQKQYTELTGQEVNTNWNVERLQEEIAVGLATQKAIEEANEWIKKNFVNEQAAKIASAKRTGNYQYLNIDELWGVIHETQGKDIGAVKAMEAINRSYSVLSKKGINAQSYNFSQSIVEGLSTQIEDMGSEDAQAYFNAFVAAGEDFWFDIAATEWGDISSVTSTLFSMQEAGVDPDVMQVFWDTAVDGANLYIEDLEQATALQTQLNQILSQKEELSKKLTEGTASYDEVQALIAQGYDPSAFYYTGQGYAANEDVANRVVEDAKDDIAVILENFMGRTSEIAQGILQGQLEYMTGSGVYGIYSQVEKFGIDTKDLEAYADELQKVNTELDRTLALRVALSNTKLNKGFREIVDSYEEWTNMLDNVMNEQEQLVIQTSDDAETFNKLKASVNMMLDTSEDLSDAFWNNKQNMDDLRLAAEGDIDALERLRRAASYDYTIVSLKKAFPEAVTEIENIANYILNNPLPDMEVGVELPEEEYQEFIDLLNAMIIATGATEEQVNAMLSAIGWEAEVTYKPIDVPNIALPGYRSKSGHGDTFDFESVGDFDKLGGTTQIGFPQVRLVSTGSGRKGITPKNLEAATGNRPSSSGSGSSGSSSKPSYWKNPYDELFNLQERINEALREREALERRYQKLLKSSTATLDEIRRGYREQIEHLQTEINLQRQLAQGRLNQIHNLANQYYTDSEGNRRTFASLGVTQYASYNEQTGLLQIDWDRLEQIANDASRTAEGEAAEAYINALQNLVDSYEDVRDAIWDIEDQIEDLNRELIESYTSFEDRVMDAVVAQYEREIDSLEKINDAINDATSKVLDGIQKEIDAQRQQRENERTEQEIAEKEARLAYLRADTSGANALEIAQLEQELEEMRQDYEDSLIDQALEQMREEADLAAEQRAEQIELMRAQLDEWIRNGDLWEEVYTLIGAAWNEDGTFDINSDLVQLLQATDAFQSLSEVGQQVWLDNLIEQANTFVEGIQAVVAEYWDKLTPWLQNILIGLGADTTPISGGGSGGGSSGGGTGGGTGGGPGGGYVSPPEGEQTDPNQANWQAFTASITNDRPFGKASKTFGIVKEDSDPRLVKAVQFALHRLNYRANNGEHVILTGDFDFRTKEALMKFQRDYNLTADGKVGNQTRSKFALRGYKTGGLADFTGPAWLDGTRTHPELVLNAQDTQNFIALKDILSHMFAPAAQGAGSFGDAYFDIDINADISSDYDVDQLVARMKEQIVRDAHYRNINSINLMR